MVAALLDEINQWVPPAGSDPQSPNQKRPVEEPGRQSPAPKSPELEKEEKAKKAEREPGGQEETEPKTRNDENVDQRRRRRQEALGDREFKHVIADKASARTFFRKGVHGYLPKCYICPEKREQGWTCSKNHDHEVVEVTDEQGQILSGKCPCCEYQLSLTAGTIFHGTHFSFEEMLIALRYMIHFRSGVSAQDVAGFLNDEGRNVSEGAVRMLMHRLRECMWENEPSRFTGETEIDEMLLRLNCGKRISLIVAYNRPTRRIRFKIVERMGKKKPKATKREMLKFICETTVPGSTILSDGDASIPDPAEMRRQHWYVNHKRFQFLKYVNLDGVDVEVTSNRVEGKQGFLRVSLGIRNGITRHHLDRYLMELAWRINHQHNRLESQNYDGRERRELSLMRNVLAGASRRKMILGDLRGKPQEKRDRTRDKNRTAPVSDPAEPQQRPLLPPGPIVPGASQSVMFRFSSSCRCLQPETPGAG